VGLFRRNKPLHEQLAEEGGMQLEPLPEPGPPGWLDVGIHGVSRPREWDAVVPVEAEVAGDHALFVALPDGTLLVEEGGDVQPLVEALEGSVAVPYRAEAVRRGDSQWAVGVRQIQVVELPDGPDGNELTLTVRDDTRELLVDGTAGFGSLPALERLGDGRGDSYVVQGQRLDRDLWEVRVVPL
jgi:hypothetical protein